MFDPSLIRLLFVFNKKKTRIKLIARVMNKSGKYLVEFAEEKVIEVSENQSILDASLSAGIPHFHACGGSGSGWLLNVNRPANVSKSDLISF